MAAEAGGCERAALGDFFGLGEAALNVSRAINVSPAEALALVLRGWEDDLSLPLIRHPLALWLFTVLYGLVLVVGVVGNVSTVCVVRSVAQLHSNTNFFLSNLAVSDLLLLVFGVPSDLWYLWFPKRFVGGRSDVACVGQGALLSTASNASILTIVALSWERYVAICHPFRLRSLCDRPRLAKYIALIWATAAALGFALAAQFQVLLTQPPGSKPTVCGRAVPLETTCDYSPSRSVPGTFEASVVLLFVVPMGLTGLFYVLLLWELRRAERSLGSLCPEAGPSAALGPGSTPLLHRQGSTPPELCQARTRTAQQLVIRMLGVVIGLFFVSYLPYHVQRLVTHYGPCGRDSLGWPRGCRALLYAWPLAGLLHFVSAAANPIIYSMMSLKFRVAFVLFFKRIWLSVAETDEETAIRLAETKTKDKDNRIPILQ